MHYNEAQVKAIKLAVWNMEGVGEACAATLLDSISWLLDRYESTKKELYLIKAVWHIYAYVELGFPYSALDKQLGVAGAVIDDEKAFIQEKSAQKERIPLTKSRVSGALGRWNPKLHSMPINEAVSSIIERVSNRETGAYLYHSGREITEGEHGTLWQKTFWLYVSEGGSVLQDLMNSKYYVFMEDKV